MVKRLKVVVIAALLGCGVQGVCTPVSRPAQHRPAPLRSLLSAATWHRIDVLHPGMTPAQVMDAGSFVSMIPTHGSRPGWRTLAYLGPLTDEEMRRIGGEIIAVDVQVVRHSGPVSALNPSVDSISWSLGPIDPASVGDSLAAVSAPYLSDGGTINLGNLRNGNNTGVLSHRGTIKGTIYTYDLE